MTRKAYRARWVRNDYAQRRANGQCTRCPAAATKFLCDACREVFNIKQRVRKGYKTA